VEEVMKNKPPSPEDLLNYELNSTKYPYKDMEDEDIRESHELHEVLDTKHWANIPPPIR